MVRAKMKCNLVRKSEYGEEVRFNPVYAEDGPNKAWSQATPSGDLYLCISNPAAQGKFETGKEYFVDISPASE